MPGIIENMLFATVLTCICGAAMPAAAQTRGAVRPEGTKLVPPPKMAEASPMAKERELLCGGYLRVDPPKVAIQIAGAEQEVERRMFAQGNFVYIDGGRKQGLEEGQIYSVIRPRGNFKSPW